MRGSSRARSLVAVALSGVFGALGAHGVLAQSPPPPPSHTDHGVVSDDDLTLVVGTRFVASMPDGASAKAQFTGVRIPLSAFNETDHCIDQRALEVAQEYFTTLGRVLGKAGHYYFVPDEEIKKAVEMCERLHRGPPAALDATKTKIIAFGQVVPTANAPALEKSIR